MSYKIRTNTVINSSRNFVVTGASGKYDDLNPSIVSIASSLNFNVPIMSALLTTNTSFTEVNKNTGRVSILLLDRSPSGYTPTFSSNVQWTNDTIPNWSSYRYWMIGFVCWDTTIVRAVANGGNG